MSLQTKVMTLIVAIFLTYGVLDYAVQQLFVLPSFQRLEREEAQKDLDRVLQALDRETQHLAVSATDWATWDDTYQFVADHNAAYREANLSPEALKSLKVNVLAIVDTAGTVAWTLAYDLHANREMHLPEWPTDRWPVHHPMIAWAGADSEVRGLQLTSLGPLLVAARPILTSNSTGPIRGSVVFGRLLDSAAISAQTQVPFQFTVLDDRPLHPEEQAALQALRHPGATFLREEATVTWVYHVLPDLFGKAALLLRIEVPRTISARGQATIHYALLSLFGVGLVILVGLIIGLRRVVLAPLQKLTAHVVAVGQGGDFTPFLWETRRDELGRLAFEFNKMVEQSIRTRNRLIEQSYQLGVAEASAQTRAAFLSNMSHEMRTPMNAIMGFSYLCAQTAVTPEQRHHLTRIDSAAETLLRLIDDLLDFSKIETGQLQLNQEPFDLKQLLAEVAEAIHHEIQRKGLTWVTDFDPRLPTLLVGDELRLRQVLRHLLDNAVKFTEAGSLRLGCEVIDHPTHAGVTLRFLIQDTGIGLSIDQQAHLFEPFIQGDGSTTRRFGGTGLGLAMSRLLVELMGGKIGVESNADQGSTFWFTVHFGLLIADFNRQPLDYPPPELSQAVTATASLPTMDRVAVNAAIVELANKLRMHDFTSSEPFKQLHTLLTDPTLKPLLDTLGRYVERFQFDLALAQLQTLTEHLNLPWSA